MGSKNARVYVRLSGQVESDLRKLYRARLLDLRWRGKKDISFNAFLVHCLEVFEESSEGRLLRKIYNQELFDKEKKEKKTVLEKRKAESASNKKNWEDGV